MITLGGDAELELVDTLDPFSEGVVFSVRPPKKSWKNIANLSGGEKVPDIVDSFFWVLTSVTIHTNSLTLVLLLLADIELFSSCFCTASLQAYTSLCDGWNRCRLRYLLWIVEQFMYVHSFGPIPISSIWLWFMWYRRLQECLYCGTLCKGQNQGCTVHNHKVSWWALLKGNYWVPCYGLRLICYMICAAFETICLSWRIDLLGYTKLIIAQRALPSIPGSSWFVKMLLLEAIWTSRWDEYLACHSFFSWPCI